MKRALLVLCLVLSIGCGASAPVRVTTAQGHEGYNLECTHDRSKCLAEAGEYCGSQGYHITNESSHAGGMLADALPGPVTWFEIQVECGQAPVGYVAPRQAQQNVYIAPQGSDPISQLGKGVGDGLQQGTQNQVHCTSNQVGNTTYTDCH